MCLSPHSIGSFAPISFPSLRASLCPVLFRPIRVSAPCAPCPTSHALLPCRPRACVHYIHVCGPRLFGCPMSLFPHFSPLCPHSHALCTLNSGFLLTQLCKKHRKQPYFCQIRKKMVKILGASRKLPYLCTVKRQQRPPTDWANNLYTCKYEYQKN